MSFGSQINYKQLLERHGCIRVPMIQRDYAQGRPAEKEVREEFLKALKDALSKPADDPSLPLNLDFIYGSVEGNEQTRFLPLDGQQRLTTLFLLHWYLAWRDDQWTTFEQLFLSEDRSSRFAYSVRPSSNEFFDQLVSYRPALPPEEVQSLVALIADQPWYFRSWRLDPTIQAVLHMLDAIHNKFYESEGLFARLVDDDRPAITFLLLDLENFGLSDDLYIKMNARGKPLTAFETFKARYEQGLANQLRGEMFSIGEQTFRGAADYIAIRMDTAWADLFWKHRSTGTNLYDAAFMNVIRAVALITRDPEPPKKYLEDFTQLRTEINPPSYTDFHSYNWLDEDFTRTLMRLLDAWCGSDSSLHRLLPDGRYLNEKEDIFDKIMSNGANLSYVELVQFTGYGKFIVKHQDGIDSGDFQEWMRIVRNLGVNTVYNRPDDFRRSVRGLVGLIEYSGDILAHFAQSEKPTTGFSEAQIAEEKLKAQLILADEGWRELIDRAEGHGYFRGQIGFLLNFAGLVTRSLESEPSNWDASEHVAFQKAFERYLDVAETMFSERGLTDLGEYRWQRALLSLGDYFLPSGRNRSFLVDSVTEEASWKRLLSGSGNRAAVARNILKSLWQKLVPDADISEQLDKTITGADSLDPWRKAMISCPAAFDYCDRNSIRVNEHGTVYLLKRSQMNGAHAELFTFCIYDNLQSLAQNGGLTPLKLMEYYFSKETAIEPGIRFDWSGDQVSCFALEGGKDDFVLYRRDNDESQPRFVDYLIKNVGFKLTEQGIERKCAHSEIISVINELRDGLVKFTEGEG
ncbi:MAG TPA: DUF262 domain-containing protein [Candidatus Fermentibacter daniensis]|mgnify:FL=1|jgi:hypothetical protein|nr:DUF262 domain-containing protein [Candidatus Fermentibacter sp.]HOA05211.1 DUF262 domain-containing protein [Candidatus Fermentibacter daniensis]HOD19098.1 DUF262 domain-containing protein [Candidatus Fermentibacter daniensis]HOF65799.1 DUF262 domain-containing protein [Candidatus Fermentibacter daniensis]HOG54357.1 DUF262 domain-containing protein [Candidatus Fermentibacter daniensis]